MDVAREVTPVPNLFLHMLSFVSGVSVNKLRYAHNITTKKNMLVLPAGAALCFSAGRLTFDKNVSESHWYGLRYALTRFKRLRTNLVFDYADPDFIKVHRLISQVAHSYVGRGADRLGDGLPRDQEELVEEAYRECEIARPMIPPDFKFECHDS
ncbi:hypothetical protein BDQ17DRAFT_765222 [Cyathus striatus]|nr:hypothetical protein BDQ17DRAFT_765222 [Cyathus striatus]